MFCWRITKYNPQYRNSKGHYVKDEWTAISDIGTEYENKKFTFEQYITVENTYIAAIELFMDCTKTSTMCVTHLEKYALSKNAILDTKAMEDVFNKVISHLLVHKNEIEMISRLVLREVFWCVLKAENMRIHFGYDYYMYIESTKACKQAIQKIEKLGLFVEPARPPEYESDE